jgi:hypothetical protein
MDILIPQGPQQKITIPDPYNDAPLTARVKALEDWVAAHSVVAPLPISSDIYGPGNAWGTKQTGIVLSPQSSAYKTKLTAYLRSTNAWINGVGFGPPIYFVTSTDPIIKFQLPVSSPIDTELRAGIHVPSKFAASPGTDGHVCIIDLSANKEYDLWQAKPTTTPGIWTAASGGILPSVSVSDGTLARLVYWNSATATHLPLAGGVVRKVHLESGIIPCALAFATPNCASGFVYPAKSSDGSDPTSIPAGTRFRFPLSVWINPAWTPLTKMLVVAARDYGIILRDTTGGSATVFYVEDTTQYGITSTDAFLAPYLAGKHIWDVVGTKIADGEFPWSQLVVYI